MLADDLLEDARALAVRGGIEDRESCMRRAISTAYYAVFHLFVEDFVQHWQFQDQRARLARMFSHQKMRDAGFDPVDRRNPTQVESDLVEIIRTFRQLQADRHRADYDVSWKIEFTEVADAIALADDIFDRWRRIRGEDVARHHLLSMFGANR